PDSNVLSIDRSHGPPQPTAEGVRAVHDHRARRSRWHGPGLRDVGADDGTVFLVMQLVAGEPIDRWVSERQASPRTIVAAFCQAGRGLAAAHAAGLVHCDFKPANVLVDHG